MDPIKKAYKIAVKCLRSCYAEHGILAGTSLWDDYWSRDSFFASWAALELKDYEIVKKNLLFFIKHQKKNGLLPLRVDKYTLILKLIGIRINRGLRPRYLEDKMRSYPRDQNSLFVITALDYVKKTKDLEFAKRYFNNFERAIGWNLSKDSDDDLLVEENYYSTWADSIRKSGKVLYTNVLHCKAVESMAEICKIVGKKEENKKYCDLYQNIKEEINRIFWLREHYADWMDWRRHHYFSSDGNILAILFDIADRERAKSILGFIERNNMETFGLATNFPNYYFFNVSLSIRLAGLGDYHNGAVWLWLGCLDAIARLKLGQKKQSKKLLKKIAEKIIEYKTVYEVYEKNGKPVHRAFFKSESCFAWSAAFFVLAVRKLKGD